MAKKRTVEVYNLGLLLVPCVGCQENMQLAKDRQDNLWAACPRCGLVMYADATANPHGKIEGPPEPPT